MHFNHGDHICSSSNYKNMYHHHKWKKNDEKPETRQYKSSKEVCYWCGVKGHWSRTYHTPKHLVDLYQASLKKERSKCRRKFYFRK